MRLFGREQTAEKHFFDGTHRMRTPAETLAAYRPLMTTMGITRLANVTGLDRIGLPVCVAIRPNSRALATSQGKGETIEAAKASALMESIESWHGERIKKPVYVEAYTSIGERGAAIDPRELAVRADASLDLDRPIEWIEGEDLCSGSSVLVPYECITTNFVEWPNRRPIFLKSSNGLASGNHILEAVVHAILEVIERDALTLWTPRPESERKRRQVTLDSITHPRLRNVIDIMRDKGIAIGIWDITSDIAVPAFTCTLIEDAGSMHWRPIPKIAGHGAHLRSEIALSRAIHEAIQSRVTVISGSRDDMFPRDYRDASGRDDHLRSIVALDTPPPELAFNQTDLPLESRFEDDLAILLSRFAAVGIRSVAAVDLSHEEIGVPVVKVVVPGLEPVHTGFYRPGPRAARQMKEHAE